MPADPSSAATLTLLVPPSACPRCQGCGKTAEELMQQHPPEHQAAALEVAAGDLECRWLLRQQRRWTEVRFCDGCAPRHGRWPIECTVCTSGDGPIMILSDPYPALPGCPTIPALVRKRSDTCAAEGGAALCMGWSAPAAHTDPSR